MSIILKLVTLLLLSKNSFTIANEQDKIEKDFNDNFKTIFVFEMNRHGARSSHIENPILPKNFYGEGVELGFVTEIGRI